MKKIQNVKSLRKPVTALISSVVIGLGISGIYSQISNQEVNYSKGINKGIIRELQRKEYDTNMTNFVSELDAFNKEYFAAHPNECNFTDIDTVKDYIVKMGNRVEIPSDVILAMIDYYSNGEWNTNGKVSAFGDVGFAHVNLSSNRNEYAAFYLSDTELYLSDTDRLDVQKIQYDPYASINVFAFYLKHTMLCNGYTIDDFDYEGLIGAYIGGADWENYEGVSREVEECMQILEEKYMEETKSF